MYADTSCFESQAGVAAGGVPRLQRAVGHARVSFRRRGGATVLDRLYQEGAAKVRLPRAAAGVPEAVLINTAGGLTGGDAFTTDVALASGSRAVLTTQACERVYRSTGAAAEVRTRFSAGAGARIDWLPQETILFDGGRLSRRLDVDLAEDAELLAVESVIFGREAMGETVENGCFRDRWRIRRDGRLVFADDLKLDGGIAALLARPAVLAGGRAMATVLYAGSDCERLLEPVREAVGDAGGASAWKGNLVARLAAADGFSLRRSLIPVLSALTAGRPLPKVWQL